MAHFGLADAVDATESLLKPVRVPREVVVDHQVRTLKVDALTGSICGQEHLHLGVVPERLLHLRALLAPHASVNADDGLGTTEQSRDPAVEIAQSVPVLR